MSRVFIDSFSGAVVDLPKADRTDENILAALSRDPKVSTWDMDQHHRWLQPAISRLVKAGRLRTVDAAYPWLKYEVVQ
jgi:hypothetical protein